MSLLPMNSQAICTSLVLAFKISRSNKEYALPVYLWELFEPSGVRTRTNTEVRSALPSAKPSLPRELLRGEPPNVPEIANVFSKSSRIQVFCLFRKVNMKHKQLQNGIGRAVGPPTHLGYGIPTHLPMPKSFVNANPLAEIYLKHIRKHGNKVEKTRARTCKASIGHTMNTYQ